MDTQEALALPLERPASRERFYYWLLFIVSSLAGAIPVLGGLAVGVAGVVASVRWPELMGAVGLLVSLGVLFFSLLTPALVVAGLKAQDFLYGVAGAVAIAVLWPTFAFTGYLLSYMLTA